MFLHNYLYRLKCIVRDKQTMFWTFLFPILLATLFNMAFSNLSSAQNFTKIKVGIIKNEEYKKNTDLVNALEQVSVSDKTAGELKLFDVSYNTKEEAEKLLEDDKIEGYIYFDNGAKLVVQKSGLKQTIMKNFLDDFKQSTSTVTTIISVDPAALQKGLIERILNRNDYIKEVAVGSAAPDTTVNYFYALIGMACLYGSFCGLKEINSIQANLSAQGARLNIVPVHKMKVFIASMAAAATMQLINIYILLGYLSLILKINFGTQFGYIALTCFVGTITGVTYGTCISSVIKRSEGLKIGILIGHTMIMSFLSGMMYDKMKYIISTKAPIVGYLNPANLITDSFYTLYYYNTHTRFFTDIAILCAFSTVFSIITYFAIRRERYASL